jgi:glycosyltransferase involved in cell wall biosynthesis
LEIGSPAPVSPQMLGVDGRFHALEEYDQAEVLVVVFIGNGCPTVRAYDERLKNLHGRYGAAGMQLVAVNANNAHLSPFDTPAAMVDRAQAAGLPFPYLKDEDGSLARAMGAISTPHAFVFDADRRLRYSGRIDDAVKAAGGATPEAVLDGKTGFVVDARDGEELAGAIARLLEDPDTARKMGAEGRAHVEAEFSASLPPKPLLEWLA